MYSWNTPSKKLLPYRGGWFRLGLVIRVQMLGQLAPGRVSLGKFTRGRVIQRDSPLMAMIIENKDQCTYPDGYWCPDRARPGSAGERLVAGPSAMGTSWAQHERGTWLHPSVRPPLEEVKGVRCNVDWLAGKGEGLGSPILSCSSFVFLYDWI